MKRGSGVPELNFAPLNQKQSSSRALLMEEMDATTDNLAQGGGHTAAFSFVNGRTRENPLLAWSPDENVPSSDASAERLRQDSR